MTQSPASATRFNKPPYRKDKPIYTHCEVPGHTADKCYRLHGFPPGFKFTKSLKKPYLAHSANHVQATDLNSANHPQQNEPQQVVPQLTITSDQCQQLLSLLQQQNLAHQASTNMVSSFHASSSAPASTSSEVSGHFSSLYNLNPYCSVFSSIHISKSPSFNSNCTPWIIDTEATDHMINCSSLFTTITAIVSTFVKLPNGSVVPVTHIRTVFISDNLILTEVLCVPSFSFNLISASKIIKVLKACLIFLTRFCFIQNLCHWKTIGVGKGDGGLFYLLQEPKVSTTLPLSLSTCFNSIKTSFNDVWHYRLGYPSVSRMQSLHNTFPEISCNNKDICSVCPLARQHRLSFPVHNSHTCMPFELVHCDI